MEKFDEYLKNSNSVIRLESERIINVLKRYGFEVVNEIETKLFIAMSIESIGNKTTIAYLIKDKEMSGVDAEKIIIDSIHVCFLLLHAMNGHPITKEQMRDCNYLSKVMEQEAHFGQQIMGAIEGLTKMADEK